MSIDGVVTKKINFHGIKKRHQVNMGVNGDTGFTLTTLRPIHSSFYKCKPPEPEAGKSKIESAHICSELAECCMVTLYHK